MHIQGDEFLIDTVGVKDAVAILDVYSRCEDFLALGPVAHASMQMVLDDLALSETEGGCFCGIYVGDEMVGVVDFVPDLFDDAGVAFLSLVMIAAEHRGRGLGRRVVEAFEAEMVKGGRVTEIRSAVQVNNESAVDFWKRMGYCVVGGPEKRPDTTVVLSLRKSVG